MILAVYVVRRVYSSYMHSLSIFPIPQSPAPDILTDLKGITSKIPYLAELGVDAVSLSPFYPSALKDGGCEYRRNRDELGHV